MSILYFTASQGFARYSPKYPETNVISLHKIEVSKISSFLPSRVAIRYDKTFAGEDAFLLNKYAVHNF